MPLTDGSSLFMPLNSAGSTLCLLSSNPFAKTFAPLLAEVVRRTRCDKTEGQTRGLGQTLGATTVWQTFMLCHRPSLKRTNVSKKAKTCTLPPYAGLHKKQSLRSDRHAVRRLCVSSPPLAANTFQGSCKWLTRCTLPQYCFLINSARVYIHLLQALLCVTLS